jgi:hypothetical protein
MKKNDIELVRRSFESKGYVLLTSKWVNNRTRLDFICPEGHLHFITWDNWNYRKQRCGRCKGNMLITIDNVKTQFGLEGYTLLSADYINAHSPLHFICPKGHRHYMEWAAWQQGHRCGKCFNTVGRVTYETIKDLFAKDPNYELLSTEYINADTKLEYRCPKGRRGSALLSSWRKGHICHRCFVLSQTSRLEQEVKDYVSSVYLWEFIENDRTTILNPHTQRYLEFDLWFPGDNKAIEFNGDYWHSFNKSTDSIKIEECGKRDIKLLVIKEFDWLHNKKQVKADIRSFLGIK